MVSPNLSEFDPLTPAVNSNEITLSQPLSGLMASPNTSQTSSVMDHEMTEAPKAPNRQEDVVAFTSQHGLDNMPALMVHSDEMLNLMAKLAPHEPTASDQFRGIEHDRVSETSSLIGSQQNLLDSAPGEFVRPHPAKRSKRTYKMQAPPPPLLTSNQFAPLEQQDRENVASPRASAPSMQPEEKCPPIVIHNATNWNAISAQLRQAKINYQKAKATSAGINVYASSVADFRAMLRLLDKTNYQYHFFRLRSEKPLKIIIRGLPSTLPIEEVHHDLHEKGYKDFKLTRLANREGKPMPLLLVEIPKLYKNLYRETVICGLVISTESQYRRASTGQCHRCQRFGHAQSGCRADYRCLKCAENHSTHLCTKPTSLPARCANCQGEHPANFSGCSENPRARQVGTESGAKQSALAKTHPSVPAWRPRPANPLPPTPLINEASFPPLPRGAPAATPPSNSQQTPCANRKDAVAFEIGQIFLLYCELRPTPPQLAEMTARLMQLTRLAA